MKKMLQKTEFGQDLKILQSSLVVAYYMLMYVQNTENQHLFWKLEVGPLSIGSLIIMPVNTHPWYLGSQVGLTVERAQ